MATSIIGITKEANQIFHLLESEEIQQQIEENHGEIPEELTQRIDSMILQFKEKSDSVGFAQVMHDKEIEALQIMKKSIEQRIRSKKNATERFKAFLAPIVRQYGEENKSGYKQLVGDVVKIKDISNFVFELDFEKPQRDQQIRIEDYPEKYQTMEITIPKTVFDELPELLQKEILSAKLSINTDKLKDDFNKKMAEGNKAIIEKKLISFPDLVGISQKFQNKVSFLGLKKLEVNNEG